MRLRLALFVRRRPLSRPDELYVRGSNCQPLMPQALNDGVRFEFGQRGSTP